MPALVRPLSVALLLGAALALVMLAFMRNMRYRNRTINLVIVARSSRD
jgi:hypothetical protein